MCKKSCDWQIDCKAIKVTIPTFGTETVKKIKIPIKTVNTVFASKISGGVKRGNQSNETRVSVAAMAGNFSRTSRKRLNRQGVVYETRNFRELLLLSSEEISSCCMQHVGQLSAGRPCRNSSGDKAYGLPYAAEVKATPHNESCGALRKFCALTLLRFHGNTSSITAKPRLVSTQNLLANRSCPIMRYCPGTWGGEPLR